MGTGNQLFELIFHRPLTGPGTREYLDQLAEDHPYFTPVHFFRLLNADQQAPSYQSSLAKSSLLFNNPYWLQFQLDELAGNAANSQEETVRPATMIPTMEETVSNVPIENIGDDAVDINNFIDGSNSPVEEPVDEQPPADTPEWFIGEDQAVETAPLLPEEDIAWEATQIDEATTPVENTAGEKDVLAFPGVAHPEKAASGVETVNEINAIATTEEEDLLATTAPPGTPGTPEINLGIPEEVQHLDTIENTMPSESANETATYSPVGAIQPGSHFNNDSSPLVNDPAAEDENDADNESEDNQLPLVKPFNFKLDLGREEKVTEDTITVEPLHTTDYFASLGIRLSGEIMPTDKLGKQLKSFTEWLKTMKKIHAGEVVQPGASTDKSIQQLAEQSNKEAGVLTEAMAEVLLQQGKADKAIEVYKKLSLFNPSKSAYFAAKIDQLNEH